MNIIFFVISFIATAVGSLCGIGGGVIIKPLLDSTGLISVASVSFLSSATVLSMAIASVITHSYDTKKKGTGHIELREITPLALGAAIGGILGKTFFQNFVYSLKDPNSVGAIQAILLIMLTIATVFYTVNKHKTNTKHLKNIFWIIIIGLLLGMKSAFIGIGGGPINIVILTYLFSMNIKKAAINSLYIIMFSQFAGILSLILKDHIPPFSFLTLFLMCFGGITGALIGKKIHNKVETTVIDRVFVLILVIIISINIYNLVNFLN